MKNTDNKKKGTKKAVKKTTKRAVKKKPQNKLWSIKKNLILAMGIFIFGIVFSIFSFLYIISDLPPVEEISNQVASESTKIYDRTGEVLLYEIHGNQKRTSIPLKEIPENIKHATISIEDANFYNNPAFDWRGILRAMWFNISHGGAFQGGSTITQQLVKNAYLTPERTITRKIKELVIASRLEKHYSKDEILELYLNQVPYGSNVYGVEEASRFYFDKNVRDINANEAAMLAALTKAPTYYSPWGNNFDKLINRKNLVLERMYNFGYITEEELSDAKSSELDISQGRNDRIKAPHFVLHVQEYLNKKYGENYVRSGGLEVVTTLDWELAQLAEEAVKTGVKRNSELYGGENAAMVAIDPKTGQVLSLVGSADYFNFEKEGNFNVATLGLRQPGSAFKPFAYMTAFQKGFSPETILWDTPTEFSTSTESYRPQNFNERFAGPITMKSALAESINVPAVKALYLAGIDDTIKTAETFGLTTLSDRSRLGLSLVLGGGEVKLIELVNAYGVLATEGIKNEISYIISVKDRNGNILEEYQNNEKRVIEKQYPRLINDILSDPELRAPLFSSSMPLTQVPGYQVALKTGTTNNYVDAWTIGYTPNLVVGVWAGNNDREPLRERGGSVLAALPMWSDFFSKAIHQFTPEMFNKPEPVKSDIPIIRGELEEGDSNSILYHLGRFDASQFKNWEDGILTWLENNSVDYSKFKRVSATSKKGIIAINSPQNGDIITNEIEVSFSIEENDFLDKIEIYLNGNLIDQQAGNLNQEANYNKKYIVENPRNQNLLEIKLFNSDNELTEEKSLILFK